MVVNFGVIENVDEINSYPSLLGLDQDFDMDSIINLKRRSMVFKKNGTMVVVPLDPFEGVWYIEIFCGEYSDEDIDHIYKLTMSDEDWINPTIDGRISLEKDSSCVSESDEELENQHNRLHEVSNMHCNRLTKSLCYFSTEVCNLPYYGGIGDVSLFIDEIERDVLEEQ